MDNKDYNTTRNAIILPDYGRNIQKMVEHISTIETKEERNKAANTLVSTMIGMNAKTRENASDLQHRIWSQLAVISNFSLDIDYPIETPIPENHNVKPNQLNLPQKEIRFRHYGKTVENMIEKAIEIEDIETKEYLIKTIANHMKKLYLIWNRDGIEDDLIFSDINELSGGKLEIPEKLKLVETREFIQRNYKKTNKNTKSRKTRK